MDESGKTNFLIDGFPRNKENLDGWNEKLADRVNYAILHNPDRVKSTEGL